MEHNTTGSIKKQLLKDKIDVRTMTMVAVLILLWTGFTYLTSNGFTDLGSSFITARNLSNLVRQMAIVGIMGSGMVLVIVTGGIDLSQGSVMGFVGCVAAALQVWYGMGTVEVIIMSLVLGALIGLLQGSLIAYTGVAPFIITLGGQLVFRGGILAVTGGTTIAPLQKSLLFFGQAYLNRTSSFGIAIITILIMLGYELNKRTNKIKSNSFCEPMMQIIIRWLIFSGVILGATLIMTSYKGIPIPVFIMVILVFIFTLIAEKTTFGRSIYAIGGNIDAAKYSGIHVKKNLTIVYCLNGVLASVAGLILAARLNAGTTSAGMNLELDAIAAAVIGGTSMTGGAGKVAGAMLGALIMATIDNGMSMMNMDAFWQYVVKGVILVAAVWFDIQTQKKKGK